MVYFISGHLNLTKDEFEKYYVPNIDKALQEPDAQFVVGDAPGCDEMSQKYLNYKAENVTIYYAYNRPRKRVGAFPVVGGFASYTERDAALTENSDTDIAWVRPGKENSGTAKNLKRRTTKFYYFKTRHQKES